MEEKKNIAVFTGAGVSAESGIPTFRDQNGLWENFDVNDVAHTDGWARDPELVLNFYNLMRSRLKYYRPNKAHEIIADMEKHFNVTVITQNIDDLHERAGSTKIIHLHGELRKKRSTTHSHIKYDCNENINIGDLCEKGSQLRPDVVWFNEQVFGLEEAAEAVEKSDYFIVVGTSLSVWPAAGLLYTTGENTKVLYVDPKPGKLDVEAKIFKKKATVGMEDVLEFIMKDKDKQENCCM